MVNNEKTNIIEDKINHLVEVVEFIKDHAAMQESVDKLTAKVTRIENKVTGIEDKVIGIEGRLTRVEALMVTKDYLDDKMADLKGDLVVLARKEDTKVKVLTDILHKKKVISDSEAKQILKMEPFAQIM